MQHSLGPLPSESISLINYTTDINNKTE